MKQLIEHRLEVAEYNLEKNQDDFVRHWETEIRVQELRDILKELERVEIKPEPQPIEKLFELKEDTAVWVKTVNGTFDFMQYYADTKEIWQGDFSWNKNSCSFYTHFLIAEVPKF